MNSGHVCASSLTRRTRKDRGYPLSGQEAAMQAVFSRQSCFVRGGRDYC